MSNSQPKSPSPSRVLRFVFVALLALALAGSATFGQGSWSLGPLRLLIRHASAPLAYAVKDLATLMSYSFLRGVGGVAFSETASPAHDLVGKEIALSYSRWSADGERLRVRIDGDSYVLPVYDWVLLPVAEYADSEYHACVSLFGPQAEFTAEANAYDIVYHEALQDTLLGMRVLQADIRLMVLNSAWALPSYGGVTVLGAGEQAPASLNREAARIIDAIVWEHDFRSWVLTDVDVDVEIGLTGNTVTLSGDPYYIFWTLDRERLEELVADAAHYASIGDSFRYGVVMDEIDRLPYEVVEPTRDLNLAREMLREYNQPVYDAAAETMRLAAFFRYVKATSPWGWTAFLSEMSGRTPSPRVATPTEWTQPGE